MNSTNFNEARSCGDGREFGKAKLADRDFHDPCCCFGAPLAFNKAYAPEKRNVLWNETWLCVSLAPAKPRRHREHVSQLPRGHCYCVVP